MTSPGFARPPSWLIARPRRRRTIISLTPLIDVVFILLVFFMLASSFRDWRSITLSSPADGAPASGMEDAVLVEVRAGGLRLVDRPATPEAVEAAVRAALAGRPDRVVFVKPAPGVALQEVVAVLDRLAAAGAANLSLIRDGRR